jgi:hypothetical protein
VLFCLALLISWSVSFFGGLVGRMRWTDVSCCDSGGVLGVMEGGMGLPLRGEITRQQQLE